MRFSIEKRTVHKIVPLRISSGEETSSPIAILQIFDEGITGLGEMTPFSYYEIDNSWEAIESWLPKLDVLSSYSPLQRVAIDCKLIELGAPGPIRAAVDMALFDWLGKKTALPIYDVLGLQSLPFPDTSFTIGIGSPESVVNRMEKWSEHGATRLWKLKLGSPSGIDADKKIFEALQRNLQDKDAKVYIDANGGWSQEQSLHMAEWLHNFGVIFLEQPLPRGQERQLAELTEVSPIPIFADESCLHTKDMEELVSGAKAGCDGVNIKLMKCGGIREAIRMITLARHHNLQVMLGCFSNTLLANTAAAQISPLVDYVDLDSHLNISDDPFSGGAEWIDGCLVPNNCPGLGIQFVG